MNGPAAAQRSTRGLEWTCSEKIKFRSCSISSVISPMGETLDTDVWVHHRPDICLDRKSTDRRCTLPIRLPLQWRRVRARALRSSDRRLLLSTVSANTMLNLRPETSSTVNKLDVMMLPTMDIDLDGGSSMEGQWVLAVVVRRERPHQESSACSRSVCAMQKTDSCGVEHTCGAVAGSHVRILTGVWLILGERSISEVPG